MEPAFLFWLSRIGLTAKGEGLIAIGDVSTKDQSAMTSFDILGQSKNSPAHTYYTDPSCWYNVFEIGGYVGQL